APRLRRRVLQRPAGCAAPSAISGRRGPSTRASLRSPPACVGGATAEAFVSAPRLTRLTRALRNRQPDLAIERAAAAARDWSGGTRIGEALQRFNDGYGRRGLARGAVVVILSDGWAPGEPALAAPPTR